MHDGSMDNYNPDKQRTITANAIPQEGLKNMLDLAEVISELKAVIAQQNKLLEQLSKSTTSGCVFGNGQQPQPQPNNPFGHPSYGGIKFMNDSGFFDFNNFSGVRNPYGPDGMYAKPPTGFVFNGSNNNQYPNQTPVQPNIDALPVWYKPYIPIHCLLDWSKEHNWSKGTKDIPREFKLALVNSTVYKVPPVLVCHYKSMAGQHGDWALQLLAKLKHHVGQGWCIVNDSIFDLPTSTLVHRNSGLNEGGILYRIPEFKYPDPVSEKSWF